MRFLLLLCIGLISLVSCNSLPKDSAVGTNPDNWTEKVEVAMPKADKVVDEQHGAEVWFAIGAVANSGDLPANGVAQAHYFEDGSYLQNLKVNIERPENGFFYEGWLVDGESWVSLGHLQSHFGDARHAVQFRQVQDLRSYLQVRVTWEKDDGDPAPGDVVAEGLLKVTKR
ncbi:hypothetical protein COU76_04345 [Candidatus Peregrinibacteria bacterium CG10_big_fil_rev_8_21_14_0_10_49_10]|nr:MAG: hypothetical protein COU76_04345 [Candidatus Peregrinibacteria bacterium CG10_big_fil_rev_8_21_14_0_10_49_10]